MIEHSLTARRVIAATPTKLFDAWTTPAALRTWFGPAGVKCVDAEVDLRIGGGYRIANLMPTGAIVWIVGTFEHIDRPRELTYSWHIGDEPDSRVTVRFEPIDDRRTEVVVIHARVATAAERDGHARGWDGCLDGLAALFAAPPP